ncbi:ribonuclease HII [Rhodospirillum rubrum F11]|uniref:Ribonuclease HII n=3 Tax=Rhodospirillum rubrum TaxID=1085 RepID=RNH2_RHORT|nr:ribonuclease HII [Rhodospirillum rubrum]Q2RPE1.1 RecName: Full=Ribonuclease HII; Short=RNase HII [Rhodospirillum rubrum ATCC 11170]ABC24004.1 Ribonuclease H [Rhodospirillum rubrum ATCC 11170]AEO49749.1 ribonuclease HII [Rhodospirillum rubrum F11]MBK5955688.1 ribonuclease HII [Rhodospirillum rubrum]QXG79947.1 ribonuclease HII [Rhodospirillum rubrum]
MPDLSLERACGGRVAGVDEVGRGPLAGPVVAAAVVIDAGRADPALLARLDDSKKLSAALRQRLATALLADPGVEVGLGEASVAEIDRINILQATFLAMGRALAKLAPPVDLALVDGNRLPPLPCPGQAVVRGDGLSLSIAAASIVAKVHRDAAMATLAQALPGYGWERNAGYGTAEHLAALDRLGATPHHRASFAPVREALARSALPGHKCVTALTFS